MYSVPRNRGTIGDSQFGRRFEHANAELMAPLRSSTAKERKDIFKGIFVFFYGEVAKELCLIIDSHKCP